MLTGFAKRSSLLSSLITGLVGWIGFYTLALLLRGYTDSPLLPLLIATSAALIQIAILRGFFFELRMDRSLWIGFFFGGLSAIFIFLLEAFIFDLVKKDFLFSMMIALYIGIPVGGFLSYFYQDDRRIEQEANTKGKSLSYGRDAHWLEPFGFGVFSYAALFLPRSPGLAFYVSMVGAMSGVVAAGVSHFLPKFLRNAGGYILISLFGLLQGVATGFLLRKFASSFLASPLILGGLAGGLTYLITFLRGRSLAKHELALQTS